MLPNHNFEDRFSLFEQDIAFLIKIRESLQMKLTFGRLVLSFFLMLGLLTAGVAAWQLWVVGHGAFEFRMHRERYEEMVKTIEAFHFSQNELGRYQFHNLDNPDLAQRLHPEDEIVPGQCAGMVWALQVDGSLRVWIETVDRGHAGEWGYAYSSDGKPPVWNADLFGEHWFLGKQLDAHWWMIYFDLG